MARYVLVHPLFVAFSCSLQRGEKSVRWWETSRESNNRLKEMAPLTFRAQASYSIISPATVGPITQHAISLRIQLDCDSKYQEVLGFGGAFTQAAASVWQSLPARQQDEVIQSYFDPSKGIGYTFGRIPINSCDFSPETYSFDDTVDDFSLKYFDDDITIDATRTIPMIRAAQVYSEPQLKLVASPWSPPAWMKTNDDMLHGGKVNDTCKDVWAQYIIRWLDAYSKHGVGMWGITVQNEPESSQDWESCEYRVDEEVAFVTSHLGPKLRDVYPYLRILGFDHNKDHLYEWATSLFDEASASSTYFDGIAFHWYAGSCFHQIQRVAAGVCKRQHINALQQVATSFPGKILLPTEACYELALIQGEDVNSNSFVPNGSWYRGEGYANDIMLDLEGGSSGWIDWNLLLDETGGPNHVNNLCDAPILVDTTGRGYTIHFHPQYYYLGHFSKFVRPGSIRIHVNLDSTQHTAPERPDDVDDEGDCQGWPLYGRCPPGSIKGAAFQRPDGDVVLIVLNCGDKESWFHLEVRSGLFVENVIRPHSIQTLVLDNHVLALQPSLIQTWTTVAASTATRWTWIYGMVTAVIVSSVLFVLAERGRATADW